MWSKIIEIIHLCFLQSKSAIPFQRHLQKAMVAFLRLHYTVVENEAALGNRGSPNDLLLSDLFPAPLFYLEFG